MLGLTSADGVAILLPVAGCVAKKPKHKMVAFSFSLRARKPLKRSVN